jgi:hypothetical protein
LSEQIIDAQRHSPHSLSTTKILRLASLILVGLSFVVIHFYNVSQVGDSMQWKDGNTAISAGSHPAMLLWAAIAIALFILLMGREPNAVAEGIPTRKRRVFAFLVDFWFSLLTLSTVGALIPLSIEAVRTGHFMWHFQRNYSVNTDGLSALSSLDSTDECVLPVSRAFRHCSGSSLYLLHWIHWSSTCRGLNCSTDVVSVVAKRNEKRTNREYGMRKRLSGFCFNSLFLFILA